MLTVDGLMWVFKHRALTLRPLSTSVCQVVGNDVHISLLGVRARLAIHNELIMSNAGGW